MISHFDNVRTTYFEKILSHDYETYIKLKIL